MGGSGMGSSYREDEMTEKKSDLVRAKISRRKFITTAAAAGIATPLAVACAPAPVAAPVAPVQVEVTRIVEMEGKTVVEQVMVTPTPLPAKVDLVVGGGQGLYEPLPSPLLTTIGAFARMVNSKLVETDPTFGEILPDLAESWAVSADGATYTFALRKGVKWHDGAPFTAADVVFTYMTLLHPAIAGWMTSRLLSILGAQEYKEGTASDVPGLVAVDDNTLKITMSKASPLLLQNLSAIWIYPSHLLKDIPTDKLADDPFWTTSLVGTGAFKFKEFQKDQFWSLTRNDDYWRGKPKLETYTSRFVKDASVGIISLEKGELDVFGMTTPDDIERLAGVNYLDVAYAPNTTGNGLTTGKLLANDKIRQAIAHAINRDEMAKVIYKGTAKVMTTCFMAPWVPTDGVNMHPFDPEKSKVLIKESGFDVTKEIDIVTYYTDAFNGRVLAAFQQYLTDVGLKVTVKQAEFATIEKDWNAGNIALAFGGFPAGPDPDSRRDTFYSKGNAYAKYQDDKVDELFDAGGSEFEQSKRATIYGELSKLLNEHSWVIPLWQPPRYIGFNKKFKGMAGNTPAGNLTFYMGIENWYFES